MTIGGRIRERREALNLSMAELAVAIDKREYDVWRFEADRNVPRPETIARLAQALGTSCDYLLGLETTTEAGGHAKN